MAPHNGGLSCRVYSCFYCDYVQRKDKGTFRWKNVWIM